MIQLFHGRCRQFLHDESGSVFMILAAAIVTLVTATGVAVDMARAQILQAKIAASLDSAGLAAGGTSNTVNVQSQAQKYFNANFPSGYMGSGTIAITTACADSANNSVICSDPTVHTINLVASAVQSTTFLKITGINSVNVSASSQITRATTGMELAIVLDNTGSMASAVQGGTVSVANPAKLTALKCALAGNAAFGGGTTCQNSGLVTSGLLDILFGNNASLPDLFVGVVPFSDMVNLNATGLPGSNFVNNVTPGNIGTMGKCVDSRSYTTTTTTGASIVLPSGSLPLTLDIADDPPTNASTYFKALLKANNTECPVAASHFLSILKADAVNTIKAMTANGSTIINLGFAWGWRMLSPNWTGLWGNSPTFIYPDTSNTVSLPLPYNTAQMTKVIVLMTDGENTVPPTHANNNAYELQGTYPTTVTTLDKLTKTVCDAIKSKGIIIYTIGFGPSGGVNTSLLKYCSTQMYSGDTSHYFLAPTNAQLQAAFQQIGNQLANLRVSQ